MASTCLSKTRTVLPLHRSLTAAFSPTRRTTSLGVSEDGEIPDHNDDDDDDSDHREDSLLNIKQILAQTRQA